MKIILFSTLEILYDLHFQECSSLEMKIFVYRYIVSCQPSTGKESWKYCLGTLIGSHSHVVNRADYPEKRRQSTIAFVSNSNCWNQDKIIRWKNARKREVKWSRGWQLSTKEKDCKSVKRGKLGDEVYKIRKGHLKVMSQFCSTPEAMPEISGGQEGGQSVPGQSSGAGWKQADTSPGPVASIRGRPPATTFVILTVLWEMQTSEAWNQELI